MPPNGTTFKEALFQKYPEARKPFVSLANLDIFVKKKSNWEIHTLDEYATFHKEFRRLATQLAKEKRVSADGLNRALKGASTLIYGTRFYITSQMKIPLVSRERHLQLNTSEKELSIFWKDLIIGTRNTGTWIHLCPLNQLHQ